VHTRNTSNPRPLTGPHWHAWDEGKAPDVLGEDWPFYTRLSQQQTGGM